MGKTDTNSAAKVLITGASGGIGEAFTTLLASEGCEIVAVARNEDQLNRIAGVLANKTGGRIHPFAADLSRKDDVKDLVDELAQREFSPDVVINNAGFGLVGKAYELPLDEQLAMVDVNVRAATELALRYLPDMVARKSGGVINVASLAGYLPGPHMAVYYATKAYLVSLGASLAHELKGSGVTVTTLSPGPVATGFQARAGLETSRLIKWVKPASAEEIAAAGWAGFKRGDRVVVPGLLGAAQTYILRATPHRLAGPVVAMMQRRR